MNSFTGIRDRRIEKMDDWDKSYDELIKELNELREKVLNLERSRRDKNGKFKTQNLTGPWTPTCSFLEVFEDNRIALNRLSSRSVMKNGIVIEEYSLFQGDAVTVSDPLVHSAAAFKSLNKQLIQYAKQAESIRRTEAIK
jgi:hypothetical protein